MSVPTSAMLEDLDLTSIQDERIRQCIVMLLNLVEDLTQETHTLREENQRLRDEINRLKGEQGKPSIKAGTKAEGTPEGDHSSERERHRPKAWTKGHKLDQITIDREQVLIVNPALLPPDAEFKGYEAVVVQDIRVQTDNVRFLKERFYSACAGKTYVACLSGRQAELPPGYEGEFGPGLRAQVIVFSFACQMTEPKILEWLRQVGVQISEGQIANLLTKGHDPFHAEKEALYAAGLRSSPWQHLDDTGTRVNGQSYHGHIVDNPLHTTYLTTASKDRLTVIDVLRNRQPRTRGG